MRSTYTSFMRMRRTRFDSACNTYSLDKEKIYNKCECKGNLVKKKNWLMRGTGFEPVLSGQRKSVFGRDIDLLSAFCR